MKKYKWMYKTKQNEIIAHDVDTLVEKINIIENSSINKWTIYNYLQKKIKNPHKLMKYISRTQI